MLRIFSKVLAYIFPTLLIAKSQRTHTDANHMQLIRKLMQGKFFKQKNFVTRKLQIVAETLSHCAYSVRCIYVATITTTSL